MRRRTASLTACSGAVALMTVTALGLHSAGATTQQPVVKPDAQRVQLERSVGDISAHGLGGAHRVTPAKRTALSAPTRTSSARSAIYRSSSTASFSAADYQTGNASTTPTARSGRGVPGTSATTLVLYDTTNTYGWLGEIYATLTSNLASHFGSWTAEPVSGYQAGQASGYTAVIYIGSTYDEPIPTTFLDDVLTSNTPVIWMNDNIWQLEARAGSQLGGFAGKYGYTTNIFDFRAFSAVDYKGQALTRDGGRGNPLMTYSAVDPRVTTVATARTADGATAVPWALRSGNLTYVGEIPFAYSTETDRLRVFEDMLFDALASSTPTRHRALVRLEDISPASDPKQLMADANYLSSMHVPFGFGVVPVYVDPTAPGYSASNPLVVRLDQKPAVVKALKYLQSHGGTLVEHGYTHQWSKNLPNPYTGVSTDDYEFYRVTENTDQTLNYVGPLPGDSQKWAAGRISSATSVFSKVGLTPGIFEFPHYTASVPSYQAAVAAFSTRWERGLYFGGVLSGGTIDYTHLAGQTFPYRVRDAYGSIVVPEDLGDVSLESFYGYPTHDVSAVLASAKANLVVRDGEAGFFFHPYLDISYLKQVVSGIQALGYVFASPTAA